MFYSVSEISIMAKGHGSDLRSMKACCSRKRSGSRTATFVSLILSIFTGGNR